MDWHESFPEKRVIIGDERPLYGKVLSKVCCALYVLQAAALGSNPKLGDSSFNYYNVHQ